MSATAQLKLPGRQPWKPGGGAKERRLKPDEIVGKRVRVWWRDDQCYYKGTVTDYLPKLGKHVVEYDDGDSEKVDLKNEIWRILEANFEQKGSRKKGKPQDSNDDDSDSHGDDDSEEGHGSEEDGSEEEEEGDGEGNGKKKQSEDEMIKKKTKKSKMSRPKKIRRKLAALSSGEDDKLASEDRKSGEVAEKDGEKAREGVPGAERERQERQAKAGAESVARVKAETIQHTAAGHKRSSAQAQAHGPSTSGGDGDHNTSELMMAFANGSQQNSGRQVVMKGPGFEVHSISDPAAYEVFCQLPHNSVDSMKVQSGQQCVIVNYMEDDKSEKGGSMRCKTVIHLATPVTHIRQCLLTPEGRLYLQVARQAEQ